MLEYDGLETSAAGSIIAIELEQPCRGDARRERPLFARADGSPYSYSQLNRWLHSLLAALVGEALASVLSWHSCRIELACRLRAAGASDALIQLICRWKSPASVQEYAQIGTQHHVVWLRKAEHVAFDALRANNLPALDNSEEYARLYNGGEDRGDDTDGSDNNSDNSRDDGHDDDDRGDAPAVAAQRQWMARGCAGCA